MSKRKLSRRQAWRIEKIQKERSARAEKLEKQITDHSNQGQLGPEQLGLVIAHFGTLVDIEATQGENEGQLFRCHMRANIGNLVTGDEVVWCEDHSSSDDQTGVIVARNDRNTELSRPNMHGELKPVASNIDQIIVVVAPEPEAHANLIDRYLVAAEYCGIEPIVLLNKTDLLNNNNRDHFESLISTYHTLEYKTLTANTIEENGLSELIENLKDRVSVFVGQSGVGKSSIISKLLPDTEIKVGALSEASKKGRHTTTTAKLFHFPSGGDLIDSPGIREFGLWHVDPEDVLSGFRELKDLNGMCKFRNCSHKQEPKCAIKDALASGKISDTRYNSFLRIVDSLQDVEMRNN